MNILHQNQLDEISGGMSANSENLEGAISVATGGVGTLIGAIIGLYYSDAFGLNNPASAAFTLGSAFVGTTGALTFSHYYLALSHYIYGSHEN